MGYERSDRWRDRGYQPRGYGRDEDYRARRDEGAGRYGRDRDYDRPADYDYDERGFLDRAGDEVRSWFGDEEAERRRRLDERYGDRDDDRYGREGSYSGSSYRGSGYGRRASGYPQSSYGSSFSGAADYGDYGAGRGAGATGSWGLGAGRDRDTWGHDPYRTWRRRQLDEFDRDYDEYRREHQSRFDTDFGSWRNNRQTQRRSLDQVKEHQEVVGSDGQHVGTVDHVRGDRILLTKGDANAGGHHHSVPCSWITKVGDKIELNRTADEARRVWRDEEQNSAFWGDRDQNEGGSDGPHVLNRSFSGTY